MTPNKAMKLSILRCLGPWMRTSRAIFRLLVLLAVAAIAAAALLIVAALAAEHPTGPS